MYCFCFGGKQSRSPLFFGPNRGCWKHSWYRQTALVFRALRPVRGASFFLFPPPPRKVPEIMAATTIDEGASSLADCLFPGRLPFPTRSRGAAAGAPTLKCRFLSPLWCGAVPSPCVTTSEWEIKARPMACLSPVGARRLGQHRELARLVFR